MQRAKWSLLLVLLVLLVLPPPQKPKPKPKPRAPMQQRQTCWRRVGWLGHR